MSDEPSDPPQRNTPIGPPTVAAESGSLPLVDQNSRRLSPPCERGAGSIGEREERAPSLRKLDAGSTDGRKAEACVVFRGSTPWQAVCLAIRSRSGRGWVADYRSRLASNCLQT